MWVRKTDRAAMTGPVSGRRAARGLRGLAAAASLAALVGLSADVAPAGATSTLVLSGVSCVKKACVVVGSTNNSGGTAVVDRTTTGGSAWAAQKAPAGAAAFNGISCVAGAGCIAVGQTASSGPVIAASPVTGKRWTAQTPPAADGDLTTVFCTTATACWAGGYSSGFASGAMAETTDGGATWSPESVPSGPTGVASVSAVACKGGATVHCYATGTWANYAQHPYLMKSTSKVTSWTDVTLPLGNPPLQGSLLGISCTGSTSCVTVGAANGPYILTTTDGTTWTPETAPAGFLSLDGVSCPSATVCIAVGSTTAGAAAIAATSNGGTTWTAQTAPAGVGALTAVSCAATTRCLAVGSATAGGPAVIGTTNGGTLWSSESVPVS
jgi:hypothetical protein